MQYMQVFYDYWHRKECKKMEKFISVYASLQVVAELQDPMEEKTCCLFVHNLFRRHEKVTDLLAIPRKESSPITAKLKEVQVKIVDCHQRLMMHVESAI
jgi:hypothetical protein